MYNCRMKFNKKRMCIALGTITSVVIPVTTVLSCSTQHKPKNIQINSQTKPTATLYQHHNAPANTTLTKYNLDSYTTYDTKTKTITVWEGVTQIKSDAFTTKYFYKDFNTVILPNSLTTINDAFYQYYFTNLTLGSGLKSIGDNAFYYADLSALIIPPNVTYIGANAFYSTDNLYSLIIPNGVTYIGEQAFWYAQSLTQLVIPNSVTTLGEGAFSLCPLTKLTLGNKLDVISDNVFENANLTTLVIPNSVTTIGEAAFGRIRTIKSLTFLGDISSAPKVGIHAFAYTSISKIKGSAWQNWAKDNHSDAFKA